MNEGSIIGHKYRLVSLLGRGGMGTVWRAHDLDLDAPVAVKLLDAFTAGSGDALARFNREAETHRAIPSSPEARTAPSPRTRAISTRSWSSSRRKCQGSGSTTRIAQVSFARLPSTLGTRFKRLIEGGRISLTRIGTSITRNPAR